MASDDQRMRESTRASRGPGRQREWLIAALVPTTVIPQPVPARLPTLPALRLPAAQGPGSLLVGTARCDRTGRIHDRTLLDALDWPPGHHLALDTLHGLIVLAPHPAGQHRVDQRHGITLPAAARHLCGITPHTPIMLAAAPTDQILVVHPTAITAQLLATHYRNLMGDAADHPEEPDG